MKKDRNEIEERIIYHAKQEYDLDKQNHQADNDDFMLYLSMYDVVPDSVEEEWMSNIPLPEFLTEMTVQSGIEAAQEFRRRDFVEVYIESKDDEHIAAGNAAKEGINRTLNQRHLHYFQKRMRASGLKNMSGKVYFRSWWERKMAKKIVTEQKSIPLPQPLPDGQAEIIIPVEVEKKEVIFDRYNMDVLDPRNVTLSPEYTYSLQDKKRVTVQYDTDIGEMEEQQEMMGYINLDKVKDLLKGSTSQASDVEADSDLNDKPQEYAFTALKTFKVFEVHLKDWVIMDKDGISIKPGIDADNNPLKEAKLIRIIKSIAEINGKSVLVRYQRNLFRDPFGNAYIPITMGKCYIHPTNDLGFGDGKASYPLETARNGIFNMGINRVLLATLPTLKAGTTSATEFRRTWQFQPNGIFEAYDPNDIQEMRISDDITGVNNIMSILTSSQQASNASFPTAQGGLPQASTSATATAASESRTDARSFYKGLTFDHTAMSEIYDMITWMTWQFALPETAKKIYGDKVFDFNPYVSHTYKTVTEAFETDSSRQVKMAMFDSMFAQISQIQNKNTLKALNYIMTKKFKLMGDEAEDVSDILFDEEEEFIAAGGQGSPPAPANGQPVTNQTGLPQSQSEQQLRQTGRTQ